MLKGRALVVWVAVGVALAGLSGCGSEEVAAYNDVLSQAKSKNNSEYVVQVLDRALDEGSISASDYRDSQQKLIKCYREAGLVPEPIPDEWGIGISKLAFSGSSPGTDELAEECQTKWDGIGNYSISNIYYNQVVNPKNEDMDTLIAACLVRNNLVPKDFEGKDYREFVASNSTKCVDGICTSPDGTTFSADDPLPPPKEMFLPGGKSADSFEVRKCQNAPLADME